METGKKTIFQSSQQQLQRGYNTSSKTLTSYIGPNTDKRLIGLIELTRKVQGNKDGTKGKKKLKKLHFQEKGPKIKKHFYIS